MKYFKLFEDKRNINFIKHIFINNGFTYDEVSDIEDYSDYFEYFQFLTNDTIIIYRNITVLDTDREEFEDNYFNNDIGEYWSLKNNDSRSMAIWGDRGDGLDDRRVEYQCIGYLKLEDINWKMMKYAFLDDFHHFTDEYEIRANEPSKDIIIKKCILV